MSRDRVTKEMTVNDVIEKFPKAIGVFNTFNVDSCCGGARSLEKTAEDDGVNLDALLKDLNTAAGS